MKSWLTGIRDAVAMGLAWVVGCTLAGMLSVVIFYALFPDVPDLFDIWIPVFAYPAFVGGVIFAVILRVGESGRRIHELSLSRIAIFGAAAGFLVGIFPFVLGTPTAQYSLLMLVIAIIAYTTLLGTVSAVVTALFFRYRAIRRYTEQ